MSEFQRIDNLLNKLPGPSYKGKVCDCIGLVVEADCPSAFMGELCEITLSNKSNCIELAEVIGFKNGRVLLMPFNGTSGISHNDVVCSTGKASEVAVGSSLIGRVIDASGMAIDGLFQPEELSNIPLQKQSVNPMHRKSIDSVLDVGINAINGFASIGKGQRVGLMAGSGVGKSVLLSQMCRNVDADINIIALIGERGREVEEFVTETLGKDGLKKSIVIAATAQDSPLMRVKAAMSAISIAEHFSKQGKDVFLCMDSITRFAMAQREIGLSIGEPPTVKGYTPSVFSSIPELIERCGSFKDRGVITAVFTVLVESDDFNDPVVDSVRAILDGHIVLSRKLAEQGHYPAIDIAKSVSRLFSKLVTNDHQLKANQYRKVFSDYQQNKDILELGLFSDKGSEQQGELVSCWKELSNFLRQDTTQLCSFDSAKEKINALKERSLA